MNLNCVQDVSKDSSWCEIRGSRDGVRNHIFWNVKLYHWVYCS